MIEAGRDWYLRAFETFERSLNGESASPLHAIRRQAITRFADLGFPTTKNEEWRFTDLSSLVKVPFGPPPDGGSVTAGDVRKLSTAAVAGARLVWVNGRYAPQLSELPENLRSAGPIEVGTLAGAMDGSVGENTSRAGLIERHLARHASYTDDPFTALSTAFLRDGALVVLPDRFVLREPLHLMFLSTADGEPFVTHPRSLIIAGRNCEASIIETYAGLGRNTYFTNAVTEIVLGENSTLEVDSVQQESDRAFHVGTIHAHLDRSSTLTSTAVSFGGALVRNNVAVVLDGEGAECRLNGLYVASGTQHMDNHTAIDHAKPHCSSHELYKGILDGNSRGVFNGKIFVRKDAQKTDAKQTNKNLVLSESASIDTKPQLEIFANDVRCTHGATIGQLEDESIFYLRSRGLDEKAARLLLISAFAGEVIERIGVETLQATLGDLVPGLLRMNHAAGEMS